MSEQENPNEAQKELEHIAQSGFRSQQVMWKLNALHKKQIEEKELLENVFFRKPATIEKVKLVNSIGKGILIFQSRENQEEFFFAVSSDGSSWLVDNTIFALEKEAIMMAIFQEFKLKRNLRVFLAGVQESEPKLFDTLGMQVLETVFSNFAEMLENEKRWYGNAQK